MAAYVTFSRRDSVFKFSLFYYWKSPRHPSMLMKKPLPSFISFWNPTACRNKCRSFTIGHTLTVSSLALAPKSQCCHRHGWGAATLYTKQWHCCSWCQASLSSEQNEKAHLPLCCSMSYGHQRSIILHSKVLTCILVTVLLGFAHNPFPPKAYSCIHRKLENKPRWEALFRTLLQLMTEILRRLADMSDPLFPGDEFISNWQAFLSLILHSKRHWIVLPVSQTYPAPTTFNDV